MLHFVATEMVGLNTVNGKLIINGGKLLYVIYYRERCYHSDYVCLPTYYPPCVHIAVFHIYIAVFFHNEVRVYNESV